MVIASISENGSPSMTARSLNVPGSDSSALQIEVVRAGGLARDGVPLDAGRERRAAAAEQLRVLDLAQHALGPELEGAPQRRVAALRAVVVEARRAHAADAPQQPQRRVAVLRQRRVGRRDDDGVLRQRRSAVGGVDGREHLLARAARRRPSAAPPARGRTGRGRGCGTRSRPPSVVALGADALLELRDQLLASRGSGRRGPRRRARRAAAAARPRAARRTSRRRRRRPAARRGAGRRSSARPG